ncbi:hypothetical protein [Caryophanon tenue]|uniref:Uncharacterized protein n=1 Tax=Caryophanon tenue TaxID=33978 RepID=A0A1C0YE27_9BACL|nr:hypothetical protein [Caryophanon tenue]OCS85442.1 hypothetical protein A6M13_13480 [Caryophanon tenue]
MKLKRAPLYIGVFGGLIIAFAVLTAVYGGIPQKAVANTAVIGFILIVVLELFMYVTNRGKK